LISPPITLKQPLPAVPTDLARFGPLRSGEIEILIDETGKVEQAHFVKSIHPVYDGLVLAASKAWRYEPAKADGVPVKFRKTIRVAIAEPARNQQNQQQNQQ
jgi:TonB family protein